MKWIKYALVSLLMTLAWLILTEQVNPAGFVIGYVISFGISVSMLQHTAISLHPAKLPKQIFAVLVYSVVLFRDILLSGIDVLFRIVGLRPVKPGIIAVKIQDDDTIIAGLSAHAITITPGQLVVDFDQNEGNSEYVYVHCLDVDDALPKIDAEQTERLGYLRRIRGK